LALATLAALRCVLPRCCVCDCTPLLLLPLPPLLLPLTQPLLPLTPAASPHFPLERSNLNNNSLSGPIIPDSWSVRPALNLRLDLQLARNRFTGPFPEAWAATNTSFKWLMSM